MPSSGVPTERNTSPELNCTRSLHLLLAFLCRKARLGNLSQDPTVGEERQRDFKLRKHVVDLFEQSCT